MIYKAKAKLATLLRKKSIPYETCYQWLRIGNVFIKFSDQFESVTFNDNRVGSITFCTPFSHPETLLQKYYYFVDVIKTFNRKKAYFTIPISLN